MWKFMKKYAVAAAAGILLTQASLLPARAEETFDFSYLGAVGDFTAEQTQNIAKQIYDGLSAHQTSITVGDSKNNYIQSSTSAMEAVMTIYRGVISGWDVGILASRRTISYQVPKKGSMKLVPAYLETSNYNSVYQDLMNQIDEIVSGVDESWSDAEKALYLHEYMAVHFDYDHDEYSDSTLMELQHTAYGMLKNGKAVCEGYAWLYDILLHRVGVDAMLLESVEIGHGWNLVKIDDKWYHVDVTWDDSYDTHPGMVKHDYFLKDNDTMLNSYHTSTDWVLTSGQSVYDLNVSDDYNDGFWNNCNSLIQQYQGKWFAIHGEKSTTAWFDLCDFNAKTHTYELIHLNSLDAKWARWYVFENESYYYTDTYITPAVVNGILYYTTPSAIFSLQDGQVTWLLDLTSEQKQQGYIYGMYAEENLLHYYVATAPNETSQEYVVEVSASEEETETTTEETTTTTTTTETTATTTTSTTPETTTTTTTSTTPETTTTTTTSTTPETTTTTTTSTTPETTTTTTTSTTPETTTTTTTSTTPETTTTTTTSTTPETTTSTTEPETIPEETELPVLIGDIDGDNEISVKDIITVQKYLLGKEPLSEEEYLLADLTDDQIVNIFDFIAMKRLVLNS